MARQDGKRISSRVWTVAVPTVPSDLEVCGLLGILNSPIIPLANPVWLNVPTERDATG